MNKHNTAAGQTYIYGYSANDNLWVLTTAIKIMVIILMYFNKNCPDFPLTEIEFKCQYIYQLLLKVNLTIILWTNIHKTF